MARQHRTPVKTVEFHDAQIVARFKVMMGGSAEQIVQASPSIITLNGDEEWASVQKRLTDALAALQDQVSANGDGN